MESVVQFSTIENPMNCKVFKVNLIEKLIEKLRRILLWSNQLRLKEEIYQSQGCEFKLIFQLNSL
jgi:hypothetical protein